MLTYGRSRPCALLPPLLSVVSLCRRLQRKWDKITGDWQRMCKEAAPSKAATRLSTTARTRPTCLWGVCGPMVHLVVIIVVLVCVGFGIGFFSSRPSPAAVGDLV